MSRPRTCQDVVKVIYPLYTKKGNVFSGFYTCTDYDTYKYKKVKYVRGEPMFFAEDLTNKSKIYKHISEMPRTIEEDLDFDINWKCKRVNKQFEKSNVVENYVTYLWLSK